MSSVDEASAGRSWSSSAFRWTFAALTTSMVGSQISSLALPLLAVLTLHASATQMGLLSAAALLPTFVVSLPAGVFVDRTASPRAAMITMDLVRAILLSLLIGLGLTDRLTIGVVALVLFTVGAATVVHEIAQNSFVPRVVDPPQLLDANAKLQVSYSVGESAGPGLGGLLVQVVGALGSIACDAISYLMSAALMLHASPRPTAKPTGNKESLSSHLRSGLVALLHHDLLGPWAKWGAVSVVFMGAFEAQYLLYLARELTLAPVWIGVIAVAGALGALPAALLMRRIETRFAVGHTIIGGLMSYFLLLLIVPLSPATAPVAVPLLAVGKVGQTASFTCSNVQQWSLRQLTTPGDLLGRVSAGNRFLIGTAETVGAALSGIAVSITGERAFLIGCAVLGVFALSPLLRSTLWTLRRLPLA